jgi:tRNA(fMet)-specific endonuclease VapC
MKYLIDTNVLSEAVKTAPDKSVMKMLEKCQHEMVTAAPVWHELQFGPSFVDGQIAAISVVNGLILVTRNIDDFKQFLRLKIENWHNA